MLYLMKKWVKLIVLCVYNLCAFRLKQQFYFHEKQSAHCMQKVNLPLMLPMLSATKSGFRDHLHLDATLKNPLDGLLIQF